MKKTKTWELFDHWTPAQRAGSLAEIYGSATKAWTFLDSVRWPEMVTDHNITPKALEKRQFQEREYKAEVMAALQQLAVYDPYCGTMTVGGI